MNHGLGGRATGLDIPADGKTTGLLLKHPGQNKVHFPEALNGVDVVHWDIDDKGFHHAKTGYNPAIKS